MLDPYRNVWVQLLERFKSQRQPRDHSTLTRDKTAPRPAIRQDRRCGGDVVRRVVLFERGGDQGFRLFSYQREMETFFPEESVSRQLILAPLGHSPGSSEASGTGDSGVWPPIATIRSIASRARAAICGSTVMRCSIRCSELSTFGSVV